MPAFYKSNPSHMIIENVELTVRSLSEDPNQQMNEKATTNEEDELEKKEEFLQISVFCAFFNFAIFAIYFTFFRFFKKTFFFLLKKTRFSSKKKEDYKS